MGKVTRPNILKVSKSESSLRVSLRPVSPMCIKQGSKDCVNQQCKHSCCILWSFHNDWLFLWTDQKSFHFFFLKFNWGTAYNYTCSGIYKGVGAGGGSRGQVPPPQWFSSGLWSPSCPTQWLLSITPVNTKVSTPSSAILATFLRQCIRMSEKYGVGFSTKL